MQKNFTNLVRYLFILMFSYAAISKWLNYDVFYAQINKQPFDNKYTPLLIWGIPCAEILVSLLMIVPRTSRLGLQIATAMMIFFTGYIVLIKLNYYDEVPCSCGGIITQFTWNQHLIFNLFFVITGISAVIIQSKKNS
jgi:uncharacterized membrane protein YphA (DoxX/SURF4 family)